MSQGRQRGHSVKTLPSFRRIYETLKLSGGTQRSANNSDEVKILIIFLRFSVINLCQTVSLLVRLFNLFNYEAVLLVGKWRQ